VSLPLIQLGDDYIAGTTAIFTYVGNKVLMQLTPFVWLT
jgi:hypothetical protein